MYMIKRVKEFGTQALIASQEIRDYVEKFESEINRLDAVIESDEQRFAKHSELVSELKECKKVIKQIKDRKQELVDEARLKITPEEAKELILNRWK